ncbi:TPA: hypothetical protein RZK34_001719 [Campylobacter jejuni]|nr:hypothetical protein [Campylobacter jejuni]
MKMKTLKEKIEVMEAFERGEKIQYMIKGRGIWSDVDVPDWNWVDCNYRIKPNYSNIRVCLSKF